MDTIILCHSEAVANAVREALRSRFFGHDAHVRVAAIEAAPSVEVDRCRRVFGGCPIGFATATDSDALEALNAGADEALVLTDPEPSAVHNLIDRTALRANLRREQEVQQTNAAQADKLAALGMLVAGVAHEVSNPLATIDLTVEMLHASLLPVSDCIERLSRIRLEGRGASRDELQRLLSAAEVEISVSELTGMLGDVRAASRSVSQVVGDLKAFSRPHEDEPTQVVHVGELVDQIVRLVQPQIEESSGVVERDYDVDLPVVVAPRSRLAQVFMNVLINACHAIRDTERAVHRVRIATRADDETVAVYVSDTGPGIPAESLEHIFDPFFTTKREQMGTGLGLSISRSIMRRLGGDLLVESVYGTGAEFIILLPRPAANLIDATRERKRKVTPAPRRLGVMVVDDADRLLRAYARALSRNHNVIVATDGREATDLLLSGSEVDVVLTEVSLPEMDGQELFLWLKAHRPELTARVIFVTGQNEAAPYRAFLESLPNPVLVKPVPRARLLEAIEQVGSRLTPQVQESPLAFA